MAEIIVLKCGGSMIGELKDSFFESIKKLKEKGVHPVIVHGGGPAINEMLNKLDIESEFVNGLRKTTEEAMDVAEMILSGAMTNKLVRGLQKHGISAIGITGSDSACIQAKAKDFETLGYVGQIVHVNEQFLRDLLSINMVPVISPIAVGIDDRELYNVNADSAAAAIACALHAKQLLFVTDVPGVLNDGDLITQATIPETEELIDSGVITGGMIPKVKACIDSLQAGVEEVMIVSGATELIRNGEIVGTMITKEMEVIN